MRHRNIVFHRLTKHIPWSAFDRAVSTHGSDRRVRRLRTRDQFLALLYGQFSGAASLRDAVRLLDATKVNLSALSEGWARFSEDHCAAKVHVVYEPHGGVPLRAVVTPDNVNDITPARAMPIEPGVTYVFDLGVIYLTEYQAGSGMSSSASSCDFSAGGFRSKARPTISGVAPS